MAKLIITNPHVNLEKTSFPSFHVFIDQHPVGSVTGSAQTLELDLPAGQHRLQIRSGQLPGRSNTVTFLAKENQTTFIQITEKKVLYYTIIISFFIIYYILRAHLGLDFLLTAAASVASLYGALALLHPLHLTHISP